MDNKSAERFLKDFIAWLERNQYRIQVWISGELGWSGISKEEVEELIEEFVKSRQATLPE